MWSYKTSQDKKWMEQGKKESRSEVEGRNHLGEQVYDRGTGMEANIILHRAHKKLGQRWRERRIFAYTILTWLPVFRSLSQLVLV